MKRVLLCAGCLLLAACGSGETELRAALEQSNHCETKEDCVLIGSKCPFGCYVYANAASADAMKERLDAYASDCVYSCIASQGVECSDNVCVAMIEPPAEAPPEEEANVGAACASHEECVTPQDFLIRSVCPYTSKCIDGRCSVVCPFFTHDFDPATSETTSAPVACDADASCDCSKYAPDNLRRCACIDGACMAVVD